jgi:hypothetical protein
MLAFALNSIAHVTHRHDSTLASQLHSVACGYCATFDNMAAAPAAHTLFVAPVLADDLIATPATSVVTRFAYTSAQPRAPPVS